MNRYETLLKLSCELEGLASLRVARGADSTLEALIDEKVGEITSLMQFETSATSSSEADDMMFYSLSEEEESQKPAVDVPDKECPVSEPRPLQEAAASPEPTADRRRPLFSVNDRFRFRRELFSGSDDDFNAALGLAATMDSYDEAENYFFSELEWNPEDSVVMEFMEILHRYYKNQLY